MVCWPHRPVEIALGRHVALLGAGIVHRLPLLGFEDGARGPGFFLLVQCELVILAQLHNAHILMQVWLSCVHALPGYYRYVYA